MKKIFIVVVVMGLMCCTGNAQDTQKEKNDAMKDKVVQFFNAKNADGLYSLAGANFRKQLSAEKFKTA